MTLYEMADMVAADLRDNGHEEIDAVDLLDSLATTHLMLVWDAEHKAVATYQQAVRRDTA